MEIEIKINGSQLNTTTALTEASLLREVRSLINKLSSCTTSMIIGYQGADAFMIDPTDVCRFLGQNKKVYAMIDQQEFALRYRLYELETILDTNYFVRISQSEIINLRKVRQIDFCGRGCIGFKLVNGQSTFVSRNYTEQVKQRLGL